MEKDCSTCLYKEGLCYPSTTIFNKDKTCRSYTPDYEGYIAELEKENNELKTVKIPQLERKIASIRGAHSVDCRKLNARTEQVERLKKENTELRVTTQYETKTYPCVKIDFSVNGDFLLCMHKEVTMFEKEAEEATLDLYGSADDVYGKEDYKQGFKDGAEFGYNKVNEWHKYSERPKKKINALCLDTEQNRLILGFYDLEADEWLRYGGYETIHIDLWKEIVLPELPERIKQDDR